MSSSSQDPIAVAKQQVLAAKSVIKAKGDQSTPTDYQILARGLFFWGKLVKAIEKPLREEALTHSLKGLAVLLQTHSQETTEYSSSFKRYEFSRLIRDLVMSQINELEHDPKPDQKKLEKLFNLRIQALGALTLILQLIPYDLRYLQERASLYEKLGRHAEKENDIATLNRFKIDLQNQTVAYNKIPGKPAINFADPMGFLHIVNIQNGLHALKTKNYYLAKHLLNLILEENPENIVALTYRALAFYKSGQVEEAIRDLTECARLNPNNSGLLYPDTEYSLKLAEIMCKDPRLNPRAKSFIANAIVDATSAGGFDSVINIFARESEWILPLMKPTEEQEATPDVFFSRARAHQAKAAEDPLEHFNAKQNYGLYSLAVVTRNPIELVKMHMHSGKLELAISAYLDQQKKLEISFLEEQEKLQEQDKFKEAFKTLLQEYGKTYLIDRLMLDQDINKHRNQMQVSRHISAAHHSISLSEYSAAINEYEAALALDTSSYQLYFNSGMAYNTVRKSPAGIFLDANQNHVMLQATIARWEQALDLIKHALSKLKDGPHSPKRYKLLRYQLVVLSDLSQYQNVKQVEKETCDALLKITPEDRFIQQWRANIDGETQNHQESDSNYKLLAFEAYEKGNFNLAEHFIDEAKENNLCDDKLRVLQAIIYLEQGKIDASMHEIRSVDLDSLEEIMENEDTNFKMNVSIATIFCHMYNADLQPEDYESCNFWLTRAIRCADKKQEMKLDKVIQLLSQRAAQPMTEEEVADINILKNKVIQLIGENHIDTAEQVLDETRYSQDNAYSSCLHYLKARLFFAVGDFTQAKKELKVAAYLNRIEPNPLVSMIEINHYRRLLNESVPESPEEAAARAAAARKAATQVAAAAIAGATEKVAARLAAEAAARAASARKAATQVAAAAIAGATEKVAARLAAEAAARAASARKAATQVAAAAIAGATEKVAARLSAEAAAIAEAEERLKAKLAAEAAEIAEAEEKLKAILAAEAEEKAKYENHPEMILSDIMDKNKTEFPSLNEREEDIQKALPRLKEFAMESPHVINDLLQKMFSDGHAMLNFKNLDYHGIWEALFPEFFISEENQDWLALIFDSLDQKKISSSKMIPKDLKDIYITFIIVMLYTRALSGDLNDNISNLADLQDKVLQYIKEQKGLIRQSLCVEEYNIRKQVENEYHLRMILDPGFKQYFSRSFPEVTPKAAAASAPLGIPPGMDKEPGSKIQLEKYEEAIFDALDSIQLPENQSNLTYLVGSSVFGKVRAQFYRPQDISGDFDPNQYIFHASDSDFVTEAPALEVEKTIRALLGDQISGLHINPHRKNVVTFTLDTIKIDIFCGRPLKNLMDDARKRCTRPLYAKRNGFIVDPTGHGKKDAELNQIETTLPASEAYHQNPEWILRHIITKNKHARRIIHKEEIQQAVQHLATFVTKPPFETDEGTLINPIGMINGLLKKMFSEGKALQNFDDLLEYGVWEALFPDFVLSEKDTQGLKEMFKDLDNAKAASSHDILFVFQPIYITSIVSMLCPAISGSPANRFSNLDGLKEAVKSYIEGQTGLIKEEFDEHNKFMISILVQREYEKRLSLDPNFIRYISPLTPHNPTLSTPVQSRTPAPSPTPMPSQPAFFPMSPTLLSPTSAVRSQAKHSLNLTMPAYTISNPTPSPYPSASPSASPPYLFPTPRSYSSASPGSSTSASFLSPPPIIAQTYYQPRFLDKPPQPIIIPPPPIKPPYRQQRG